MQRVVLITGCSSGIGEAAARAFLDEEWTVMATARNRADLDALREAGCYTAALDVTNEAQVESVVAETIDRWDRIDCVVNNAGFTQPGPVEDIPIDRLQAQFDVNVHGPHRLVRAVLPHMRNRENGTIVNVSSGLGRLSIPGMGAYSGSKHALEAMTDALRAEVSPIGIDVVLIEPGAVNTDFDRRAAAELRGIHRTREYASLYKLIDDWVAVDGFTPAELSSRDVAEVIVNAASATQPEPRYAVGTTGQLAGIAGMLPASLRDAAYRFLLRVTSIRGQE